MRRPNGWWWAGGGIAVSALLIIGGIGWFHSDADLRRVQAEARAAGVATTWTEAGFRDMSMGEKAALDRVIAVSRRQPSLTRKDPLKVPRQTEPPNDDLIAHHAAIPPDIWNEIDAALDGLPDPPFPLFERFTLSTRLDTNNEQRTTRADAPPGRTHPPLPDRLAT